MTRTFEQDLAEVIALNLVTIHAARQAMRSRGWKFGNHGERAGLVSALWKRQRNARIKNMDQLLTSARIRAGGTGASLKAEATPPEKREPRVAGEIQAPDKRRAVASGNTFVLTCAQNNTKLHEGFWASLMHYLKHRNAQLHVSQFVYNKDGTSASDQRKNSTKVSDKDDLWYDPRLLPYTSIESLELAPGLVWCGELNIIPTAKTPLSTLNTYTKDASGIVPHVKMHMQSIPTMKYEPVKFMYTTGTVTQRNYIQRVAGQVAEFHHVFGAIVAEVDQHGHWWVRQINADNDGGFYDLDTYYSPNGIDLTKHRVLAVTHGDIHGLKADSYVLSAVFQEGGILDMLFPEYQFFHDTIDFTPRNHHNVKDPHFLFDTWNSKEDSVEREFFIAAEILDRAHRDWCKSVVIESNHDVAFTRWLKDTSAFFDPPNVDFWLRNNTVRVREVSMGRKINIFQYALVKAYRAMKLDGTFTFVAEDDSYKIADGSIECGLHGHLGPNGSRGSPKNLRVAGKANTAHTHTAGIIDGVYTAGVYGNLDMGYNKGPSSWSHSLIVTYPNSKRCILTIKRGRAWRDIPGDTK